MRLKLQEKECKIYSTLLLYTLLASRQNFMPFYTLWPFQMGIHLNSTSICALIAFSNDDLRKRKGATASFKILSQLSTNTTNQIQEVYCLLGCVKVWQL
jgi:hypothetical protein